MKTRWRLGNYRFGDWWYNEIWETSTQTCGFRKNEDDDEEEKDTKMIGMGPQQGWPNPHP